MLIIFLDGGVSQLETWDPKPGTDTGGPFFVNSDISAGNPRWRAVASHRAADAPPDANPEYQLE